MKDLKTLKKEFNDLIENIPNFLEKLKMELGIKDFSYTANEVDKVQEWYKAIIKSLQNLTKEEIQKMFFAYCSTAFILSNGGEIILDTKNKSMNYGEPIIISYGKEGYPWVAISIFAWMEKLEKNGLKKPLSETILRNLKDISG